jgi:hypothetical protein
LFETTHVFNIKNIERRTSNVVNDVADRKNFVKRLGELSAGTQTTIYEQALMTNHAHIQNSISTAGQGPSSKSR